MREDDGTPTGSAGGTSWSTGDTEHVGVEHYVYLLRGAMKPGELLQRIHRHVLDGCATCREAWDGLVSGQRRDLRELLAGYDEAIPFDSTPPPPTPLTRPSPYETAFSTRARTLARAAQRLAEDRRQARRQLAELLAIPAGRRERVIERAQNRWRTPAFAHLLVEEARERVRRSPREAQELLDLVHPVLLWTPGAHGTDWAQALLVRAEAHRANALRVAGDLPAAERRFLALRRRLRVEPVADPAVDAEVASLEASLRADQRRDVDAVELLDGAVIVYEAVSEREGLARVLIQRAAVLQDLDRGEEALGDLDRARGLLDPREQSFLYLFTVVGTVPLLLDEGRPEEAEQLLAEAERTVAAAREPWWGLRFRYLAGRAAFALGELGQAEIRLREARDGFLAQGLPQDTANASLDLALVHLHQGRTAEVRRLCREIAPYFEGCGVERDALAILALFARATAADAAALAAELRRHLERAATARRAAPPPS
jgi:tetratricopeptide (TPR) repeat protein